MARLGGTSTPSTLLNRAAVSACPTADTVPSARSAAFAAVTSVNFTQAGNPPTSMLAENALRM